MTANDFDKILNARLEAIKTVLGTKAKEYATGDDRLHNFKAAGAITGQCPERVCVGFLVKHLVSVLDIVRDIEAGRMTKVRTVYEEKLGDCVNYLILLEAIIVERGK